MNLKRQTFRRVARSTGLLMPGPDSELNDLTTEPDKHGSDDDQERGVAHPSASVGTGGIHVH
jgi:hypothetical protein